MENCAELRAFDNQINNSKNLDWKELADQVKKNQNIDDFIDYCVKGLLKDNKPLIIKMQASSLAAVREIFEKFKQHIIKEDYKRWKEGEKKKRKLAKASAKQRKAAAALEKKQNMRYLSLTHLPKSKEEMEQLMRKRNVIVKITENKDAAKGELDQYEPYSVHINIKPTGSSPHIVVEQLKQAANSELNRIMGHDDSKSTVKDVTDNIYNSLKGNLETMGYTTNLITGGGLANKQ